MFFKKSSGISFIVVFLGNPGQEYEYTRHNAGFITADIFAKTHNVSINKVSFKAFTGTTIIGSEKVLLMKPQTYMNLSGEAVAQAAKFYKVPSDHIIVISDEMSLPIGKIRVREKGSAGGHNGLKNIIKMLGTEDFPRIRIGVGSPPHDEYDVKDWVLSKFKGQDKTDIDAAASRACNAIESYIVDGCAKTMNLFN